MVDGSHRQRAVLGIAVTVQTVAMLLAALALAVMIGFAVLNWLERVG